MRWAVVTMLAPAMLSCGDGGEGPTTVDEPRVVGVLVTPGAAKLGSLGATTTIQVVVIDQNGEQMSGVPVSWTSEDTGVATVATGAAGGEVTAVGNGGTTVTASAGDFSASARITVNQTAAAVVIDPTPVGLRELGATVQLTAEVRDDLGSPIPGMTVTWSSDDDAIATVSPGGLVTAMGHGSTTIRASSGGSRGRADVTVNLGPYVAPTVTATGPAAADVGVEFTVTLTLDFGTALGIAPGAAAVSMSWDPAVMSLGDWSGFSSSEVWQGVRDVPAGWLRVVVAKPTGLSDGQVLMEIPFTAIAGSGSDADLDMTLLEVIEALSFDTLTPDFEAVGTTVSIN